MKRPRSSTSALSCAVLAAVVTGGTLLARAQGRSGPSVPVPDPLPQPAAGPLPVAGASLEELVAGSELAFLGSVVDLRTVRSAGGAPGRSPLPWTFVTYRIHTVLHGVAPSELVTLRFIGGWDDERGAYLRASTVPQFDLGDQDVLFVAGNGEALSPLVFEERGRMRVIGGQVFSEGGSALHLVEARTRLAYGERYALEEVRTTFVNGVAQETSVDFEALEGPSDAVSVEELVDAVLAVSAARPEPVVAFASADPSRPFLGPDFTAAPPPADPLGAKQQVGSAEEQPAGRGSIVRTNGGPARRPAPPQPHGRDQDR